MNGTVERSVLFPGVVVEEGAVVRDSIVMGGSWIGPAAALDQVIADKRVHIGRRAVIGRGAAVPNRDCPEHLSSGITIVPPTTVAISKGRYRFGDVGFATAPGDRVSFAPTDSLLGRAGVNIGTNFQATEKLILAPFIHASVWHEFARDAKATATLAGLTFDVATQRVGTFGQVGAGLQFKMLDTPFLGFVRGDVRFGDKIQGKALNLGLKMQF